VDINTSEGINTSDEDNIWKLLSEKEILVMYWVCQGYSNEEIATQRNVEIPTVKTQLGSVYKKLKVPEDLPDSQKREYLITQYGSVINKLFPDRKSLDTLHERKREWEVKNLRKQREPKGELEQELEGLRSRREITEPTPPPRFNPVFLWIGLGVLGIIVFATILVLSTGNNRRGESIPTTAVALVQPTRTVQPLPLTGTSTSEPTATLTLSPTASLTPQPTPTNTFTAQPTNTPLPTNTTGPTSTSTETPTETSTPSPTPGFEFFDDFEAGMKPEWTLISGDPQFVNGMLTTSTSVRMIVGEESWSNYVVELEAHDPECLWEWGWSRVGIYAKDEENLLAFSWSGCDRKLFLFVNGVWIDVPNTHVGATGGAGFLIIRIKAEGSNFSFYVNNKKIISYYNDDYKNGKVYLEIDDETKVKYIRINSLP